MRRTTSRYRPWGTLSSFPSRHRSRDLFYVISLSGFDRVCADRARTRSSLTFRAVCSFRRCSSYETRAASVANTSLSKARSSKGTLGTVTQTLLSPETTSPWLSRPGPCNYSTIICQERQKRGTMLPAIRNGPIGRKLLKDWTRTTDIDTTRPKK
jgi:hypothetical protein